MKSKKVQQRNLSKPKKSKRRKPNPLKPKNLTLLSHCTPSLKRKRAESKKTPTTRTWTNALALTMVQPLQSTTGLKALKVLTCKSNFPKEPLPRC